MEQNPLLLPDSDREYRLDGMAIQLGIDRNLFQREVQDPRIPGHSAMHKALRLVKEKLRKCGHADCSAILSDALEFGGLHELSSIYKGEGMALNKSCCKPFTLQH